jgi:hypothetical protein
MQPKPLIIDADYDVCDLSPENQRTVLGINGFLTQAQIHYFVRTAVQANFRENPSRLLRKIRCG